MTPLPKRRLSHKRQGKRRSSFSLGNFKLQLCQNCKMPVLAHRACKFCGFYGGKLVRHTKNKAKK